MIKSGIKKGFNYLSTEVGRRTPKGKILGNAAATQAFNTVISTGQKTSKAIQASHIARNSAYRQAGRKPLMMAGGLGAVGTYTAMRPNANESRTSYRGPMQTGRGSGRYA